jgi:hypothetical protein
VNDFPALRLSEWDATRVTLRLFIQIVGKVRVALAPAKNHWWHVVLYVTPRGLTTGAMPSGDTTLELEFDFVDHALVARTERGEVERLPLRDGLSVAAFYEQLFALLGRLGIDVDILAQFYGDPTPIPFATDDQDASYDSAAVERFWHALSATTLVFEEFAGWFTGKTSPVHLFWHGMDLAVTRFSGRRADPKPTWSRVDQEAYSHEVISFGFWAEDGSWPDPCYYSYTAPEPPGLPEQSLQPEQAFWGDRTQPPGAPLVGRRAHRRVPAPRPAALPPERLRGGRPHRGTGRWRTLPPPGPRGRGRSRLFRRT